MDCVAGSKFETTMPSSSATCVIKEYVLLRPSGRDVPSQKLCCTSMYGLSVFEMSILNPSNVWMDVIALDGPTACS